MEKYGFDCIEPAYEIVVSGLITSQIIDRIVEYDLVIANMTGNNPNVMYELAIRHATAKPIIHICEKGTDLLFDLKDNRVIFYENDMLGVNELQKELIKYLDAINFNEYYWNNPLYISNTAVRMIGHTIRKKYNIIEDRFVSKIRITVNAPEGFPFEKITEQLANFGFYKADYYERKREGFHVYTSMVSDFSVDWLYSKIKELFGEEVTFKIERI